MLLMGDMASNAASGPNPSTNSETAEERRPQAGPLPRKRGEIGYRESVDGRPEYDNREGDITPLPPRHPADREPEPTQIPAPEGSDSSNVNVNPSNPPPTFSSASSDTDASSLRKPQKRATFLSWLDPRHALKREKIGGVTLGTILRLTIQIALLAGTIALWIVVSRLLTDSHGDDDPATGSQNGAPPPDSGPFGSSAAIFIHVLFGVFTLVQLLFLERCVFFVRAQRYAHYHHGATLPSHRSRNGGPAGMSDAGLAISLAPWNRPSLPTYAAALAESGVGTGDVEDNFIAVPPPPAYGYERGSTLLLAGYMRNSLRAQAPASTGSRPASQVPCTSRPVSYRGHDEEWQEQCDAERALHLADALERLENTVQSSTPAPATRTA